MGLPSIKEKLIEAMRSKTFAEYREWLRKLPNRDFETLLMEMKRDNTAIIAEQKKQRGEPLEEGEDDPFGDSIHSFGVLDEDEEDLILRNADGFGLDQDDLEYLTQRHKKESHGTDLFYSSVGSYRGHGHHKHSHSHSKKQKKEQERKEKELLKIKFRASDEEFAPVKEMKIMSKDIMRHENIILGGLGGGADAVNTLPLYAFLRSKGKNVTLVGCHGREMDLIRGGVYFTDWSKWVDSTCTKGYGDRAFEHHICAARKKYFDEETPEVLYISRRGGIHAMAHALDCLAITTGSTCIIMVDGGGDALFTKSHNNKNSAKYSSDGDALVIEALTKVKFAETHVAIVSCPIDTPPDWIDVIEAVQKAGGYEGKYDLSKLPKSILDPATRSMRSCVRMNRQDHHSLDMSLTATVFYCSLTKFYENIDPMVSWCSSIKVEPEHSYMRLFNAQVLHNIKQYFQSKTVPKHSYITTNNFGTVQRSTNIQGYVHPEPKKEDKPEDKKTTNTKEDAGAKVIDASKQIEDKKTSSSNRLPANGTL